MADEFDRIGMVNIVSRLLALRKTVESSPIGAVFPLYQAAQEVGFYKEASVLSVRNVRVPSCSDEGSPFLARDFY